MQRLKNPKRILLFLAGILFLFVALAELIFHLAPDQYLARLGPTDRAIGLKSGNLSANFSGERGILADDIHFRANGHAWKYAAERSPRLEDSTILIEVLADELIEGQNLVEVKVESHLGSQRILDFIFDYEPQELELPETVDWSRQGVEIQDGQWETTETPKGWRLRPVPGTEGYDRLALLSPPFEGGRGVSVDVTFLDNPKNANLYGFGIIPLWGGHNDEELISPRRGWEYGISWFYSRDPGIGVEFSQKIGNLPHLTSSNYEFFEAVAGETITLTAEAWPVRAASGEHSHYQMRMKWANPSGTKSSDWIEMTDKNSPLPSKDYAIALVAHRSQVEFGTVNIYTIP